MPNPKPGDQDTVRTDRNGLSEGAVFNSWVGRYVLCSDSMSPCFEINFSGIQDGPTVSCICDHWL